MWRKHTPPPQAVNERSSVPHARAIVAYVYKCIYTLKVAYAYSVYTYSTQRTETHTVMLSRCVCVWSTRVNQVYRTDDLYGEIVTRKHSSCLPDDLYGEIVLANIPRKSDIVRTIRWKY